MSAVDDRFVVESLSDATIIVLCESTVYKQVDVTRPQTRPGRWPPHRHRHTLRCLLIHHHHGAVHRIHVACHLHTTVLGVALTVAHPRPLHHEVSVGVCVERVAVVHARVEGEDDLGGLGKRSDRMAQLHQTVGVRGSKAEVERGLCTRQPHVEGQRPLHLRPVELVATQRRRGCLGGAQDVGARRLCCIFRSAIGEERKAERGTVGEGECGGLIPTWGEGDVGMTQNKRGG
mmetsp:Transcript_20522/g.48893  ORF Transcript_20522/g.48893 Transcript_20522/m.48893 type:complete len:232 (-) Transcript_20522:199-894(-)